MISHDNYICLLFNCRYHPKFIYGTLWYWLISHIDVGDLPLSSRSLGSLKKMQSYFVCGHKKGHPLWNIWKNNNRRQCLAEIDILKWPVNNVKVTGVFMWWRALFFQNHCFFKRHIAYSAISPFTEMSLTWAFNTHIIWRPFLKVMATGSF